MWPGGRRSWPCLAQPLGALLLERCRVAQEEPGGFSISKCADPRCPCSVLCSAHLSPFYSPRSLHLSWIPRLLGIRGSGSFSCHSRVPSGLVPADVVLVSSPSLCLSRTGRGAASCTDLVCIAEAVCHREDVGRASEAKKRHLSQPSPLASIMVPFCKDLAVMSV